MNERSRQQLIADQRALFDSLTGGWVQFPIDGRCYRCGCDIVATAGPEKLRSEPVTGCPKCHRSLVS